MDEFNERRYQRLIEVNTLIFEKAAAYDSAVLAGGYVGFFAIWASVKEDMPRWIVLGSGGLIAFSLLLYILFTVGSAVARQRDTTPLQSIIAQASSLQDFDTQWNAAIARNVRSANTVLRLWAFIFPASAITGIIAALLIGGAALAKSVDLAVWPTPHATKVFARCERTGKPCAPRQRCGGQPLTVVRAYGDGSTGSGK